VSLYDLVEALAFATVVLVIDASVLDCSSGF
jgi:hypothetical protein